MKNVLVCGLESLLIQTRAKVLESRGFATRTALGLGEVKRALTDTDTALIVVCSSFSFKQRLIVNDLLAHELPSIPVLTLLRGNEDAGALPGETVSVSAGPLGLIQAAERLTRSA